MTLEGKLQRGSDPRVKPEDAREENEMRSRERMTWRSETWLLLMGALVFCTGASVSGVRQARDWQYAGDLALATGRPVEAYFFHSKVAETFPGTPHARRAEKWTRTLNARLVRPVRSPASEDAGTWVEEFFDFLIWP